MFFIVYEQYLISSSRSYWGNKQRSRNTHWYQQRHRRIPFIICCWSNWYWANRKLLFSGLSRFICRWNRIRYLFDTRVRSTNSWTAVAHIPSSQWSKHCSSLDATITIYEDISFPFITTDQNWFSLSRWHLCCFGSIIARSHQKYQIYVQATWYSNRLYSMANR